MSALGSLVVKLGLEYAEFTGGLDKSEQAALASAKRVQDTFDGIKGSVAAVAGAVAGGLAAAFTVSAFKSLIGDAVAAGAALDDLAMQTGSTVDALSGLAEIGKFSDMGPEKIGAAMNMLTRNLASATEESKGAGAALQVLGMNVEQFRSLKPEDQMQAIAKALDGVQDGASKSAVMMALYGREGANMLPFMKDLASAGQLQAIITAEQAAAAAQLDDNWVKLTTTGSETAREVAMGMVPALDEAVRAAMDVMSGTGGMREMLRGLVADGSIKRWTTEAIKGLSYVADAGHIAWRVLQSAGKGMGGLAAALVQALQGDFRGAWNTLKASGEDMIDVFDGPTIGARFRDSLDQVAQTSDAAGAATQKATLDFKNLGAGGSRAASDLDKLVKSGTELTASLLAQDTGLSGDFHKKWDSLSAAYQANKVSQDDLVAAQAKLLEQQPAMKKAMDEAVKAAQAVADARQKEAEGIAAWLQAQQEAAAQSLASVQDRITGLRDEEAALSLSREKNISLAEAVELLAIARLEEKQARFHEGSEGWQAIQKEIEARKQLLGLVSGKAQREEESRGWADMWSSVDRTAHDVFVNVLEGGQDAFKRLGNTLKASVLDVLYQMTVRKWIVSIGTSVFGAGFGLAANAATGGGALSAVGSLGSGYSMLSALGGTFGGGLSAGFGGLMGSLGMSATGATLGGAMSAGGIALGAGNIAGGLGTLAGALGPIAIGLALLSSFIKKSTPHMGAASSYSEAGGLVSNADIYQNVGFRDARTYNAEAASVTGGVAKAIGDALNSTARAFGKAAGYEITTAFADDKSKDGAWGSLIVKQMGQAVLDWRDTQTSEWAPKEFADGEAGQKEYMQAISISARDALKTAIGEVEWATDMLDALGDSPSLEGLAQTVDQINAASVALGKMRQNLDGFGGLTDSAVSALVKAAGGIDSLVASASSYYDNYYSDAEKVAHTTRDVADALAAVGLEMPATEAGFRALVEQQVALGEAGTDAVAVLFRVNAAFKSVIASGAAAASDASVERNAYLRAADKARETARALVQAQTDAWNDGLKNTFDALMSGLRQVDDFLRGSILGDNSILSPEQKIATAAAQFDDVYGRALRGDADAAQALAGAADSLLTISREGLASSPAYAAIFQDVQGKLGQFGAAVASYAPVVNPYDRTGSGRLQTQGFLDAQNYNSELAGMAQQYAAQYGYSGGIYSGQASDVGALSVDTSGLLGWLFSVNGAGGNGSPVSSWYQDLGEINQRSAYAQQVFRLDQSGVISTLQDVGVVQSQGSQAIVAELQLMSKKLDEQARTSRMGAIA